MLKFIDSAYSVRSTLGILYFIESLIHIEIRFVFISKIQYKYTTKT
jgi:hypothetical protein